jgi:hypothetical protein
VLAKSPPSGGLFVGRNLKFMPGNSYGFGFVFTQILELKPNYLFPGAHGE